MSFNPKPLSYFVLASLVVVSVHAQLHWDGCTDIGLNSAEIKQTILVGRNATGAEAGVTAVNDIREPTKLAVAKNGDVYWVERQGAVKVYRAQGATVVTLGTLDVFYGVGGGLTAPNGTKSNNEFGIHGIVLDPNFQTNKYVYINYAPKTTVDTSLFVSRFTINGDVLDKASEKVVLKIPQQRRWCCHTGGAMEFDPQGNLFITVGNNTRNIGDDNLADAYLRQSEPDADDQGHAGNTNDLRGKILRITPNAQGTYSIPTGNLFPNGTANTRPEIWGMGMRNPYSIALEPYRGWVAWGDVGPDAGGQTEELNILTRPGNGGWPYFSGTGPWKELGLNVNAPANNSTNNTGLKVLPPAVPATIAYQQSTAMTGPFYYYDGANPSTRKFPPHFNKKWFVSDWRQGWLDVVTLDDQGKVASRMTLLGNQKLDGPISFAFGPDGALYIAEYGFQYFSYNTQPVRIKRLEYTGSCRPATPVLPDPSTAIRNRNAVEHGSLVSALNLGHRREVDLPKGVNGFKAYDVRGQLIWEYSATGFENGRVTIPSRISASGILRINYFK